MPNSWWINRARRGPVHNSVPNPCSVGFSLNQRRTIFSWVVDSLVLLCQLSQTLLQLRLTSIGLSECDLLQRLSENAIQNDEGLCRILI